MRKKTWTESADWYLIVQALLLICLFVYIGFLFSYKGGSNQPFAAVAGKIEEKAELRKLQKAGERELKQYYRLNAKDFEGAALYLAESAMEVEEVLLIKTKDEAQTEEVQKAAEQRLSARKADFEGYGAKQMKLLQSAALEVRGNYVLLAVSADADTFKKAFTDAL